MKNWIEVYGLSVCFAAVVCLVISTSIFGYSILRTTYPQLTMSSYQYYENYTADESNEEFLSQKAQEKRDGLQTLIQSLIFIIVAIITFFIHWRLATSKRKNGV